MTPYYADDAVTIYHGDAGDWLGEVDAILTDPPYGRAALPLWSMLGRIAMTSLRPGGWLLAYSGQAALPEAMGSLAAAGLIYRWTLATAYPGREQMARVADMTVLTGWKPILAYRHPPFGSSRGIGGRFTSGGRAAFRDLLPRGGYDKGSHEWAQPLAEATELVARFTEPGALVLDPFAGSGTFLVAAKSLGRRSVGIEIDEGHCRTAARRCSQEVLGLVG